MQRLRSAAIAGVLAGAAALVPVIASASTSHSKFWQNKANTVACGIEIHASNRPATEILCSSKGIPAPKHSSSAAGDPGFVQLAAKGAPRTLGLSQNSFIGTVPATLGHGASGARSG